MPRYHFNVYDSVAVIDKEGSQLADVGAARTEGVRLASDLLRSESHKPQIGEEWRVEVTDGRGMILFRIDVTVSGSAAVM